MSGAAPQEYECFRAEVATKHYVDLAQLLEWSGDPLTPYSCVVCALSWPVVIGNRDELKGAEKYLMKKRAGTAEVADTMRERWHEWYRWPAEAHSHWWRFSPDERLAVCEDCGDYTDDAPCTQRHIPP